MVSRSPAPPTYQSMPQPSVASAMLTLTMSSVDANIDPKYDNTIPLCLIRLSGPVEQIACRCRSL